MSKLRLGPIVDEKPVKLMIELPGSLHRELVEYAAVHARTNGLSEPLTPERIAVPMIERFIATDRGFAAARRQR
ncbi:MULTISPECIES: DUF2274 domain-containing protein [Sphingopyxis]|jgi:hypothetical protein|uniref:DUF2274 domain-containing protein n=1 Tax=Sphingopyxis granuli TaxID=267128 RepID=A0AA86GPF9_9SPHN|nr:MULTISPECIES: DUF2274 domain-containing protein [Sphingopyxis]AMG75515.1 Uncharacterized protein SGRAN_3172 [Sphingopyxis granuli]HEV7312482.1 DUF2274 domain-containing protein [Sphingopyxis sp.]